jgi:hypothetical protein
MGKRETEYDGDLGGDETGDRRGMLGRLARRLQNPKELGGDALELMGALIETSDRAKTEAVRMIAREVRTYLQELRLQELLTGHSLEVKMSLQLRPLAKAEGEAEAAPNAPTQVTPVDVAVTLRKDDRTSGA